MTVNLYVDDDRFSNEDIARLCRFGLSHIRVSKSDLRGQRREDELKRLEELVRKVEEEV